MAGMGSSYFLIFKLEEIFIFSIFWIVCVRGVCMFGDGCHFPCHCWSSSECDQDTGECSQKGCNTGRLGYSWSGPACQIGNIAYRKDTNQTGTYNSYESKYGVDGVLGAPPGGYTNCAHPLYPGGQSSGTAAEWTVNFGRLHKIYNVTIYGPYGINDVKRLTNFDIYIIRPNGDDQLCTSYTGDPPEPGGHLNMSCDTPLVGQYLRIVRTGGPRIDTANWCEVVVMGHVYTDCNTIECPDHCDEITGCSECPVGKLLPECKEDCPVGSSGVGCTQRCGYCTDNTGGNTRECDPFTGRCQNGCQMWYTGQSCQHNIRQDNYYNEYFRVNKTTERSVTLLWEQQLIDSPADLLTPYYGYIVQYKRRSDSTYTNYTDVRHDTGNSFVTTVVSGLQYNTEYQLTIKIYREWDDQKYISTYNYPVIDARTSCIAPATPSITDIKTTPPETSIVTGRIQVTVQIPSESGCDYINKRWIEYKEKSASIWHSQELSQSASSYTLKVPPGRYDLRVTVSNNQGLNTSSPIQQATAQETPVTLEPTTSTATPQPPVEKPQPTPTPPNTGSQAEPNGTGDNGNLGIIVGVTVPLIVVTAVIIAVVVILRRKGIIPQKPSAVSRDDLKKSIKRLSDGKSVGQENQGYEPSTLQQTTDIDDGYERIVTEEENPYENTPERGPVAVDDLESYVLRVKGSLLEEYKTLPEEDHSKCKLAETDENKPKNRFLNIHAYDHSRVVLDTIDDDPSSDYINANYIDGYHKPKAYIATQGPRPNTLYDFWRMVWMKKASRVVMVTNLVENTKRKCDQYWPMNVGGTVAFGVFTITMDAKDVFADYTIRVLSVKHGSQSRTVTQFHFTSWEDKKRPLYGAAPLLAFRRKIRSYDAQSKGPLIVHCSAGVGRTGTLLAIDFLLAQAKAEGQVDMYVCVKKMRLNRMNMVQTKDQYVFLHDAVLEALKTGDVFYPYNGFQEQFDIICQSSGDLGGISEIERQFQLLDSLKNRTPTRTKDGWKDANKDKNRDADIVPADTDRPYLSTRHNRGGNYINAVFVDSFKAHDSYVATQMPLPNTIVDFWRLVYDQSIKAIVMLDEIDHTDETCLQYWPGADERRQKYGPMEVELINEEYDTHSNSILIREFKVSLSSEKRSESDDDPEAKTVRQFHLLGWPRDEEFPPDRSTLLHLHYALERFYQQRNSASGGKAGKSIVHCMNGATRTGLFCAMSFVLDKLKADQEVDTFTAVRYVANRRHQFIDLLDQYKFLYQMAIEYMIRYDQYINVQ